MSTIVSVRHLEAGTWGCPVSFDLRSGELAVLLGGNSSGKTTLLNTIAGLLPVTRGKIVFAGRDVTRLDACDRADKGIRIAVEGRQVFGRLVVRRNLLLGAYGVSSQQEVSRRLDAVLHVFPDLRQKLDTPASSLSGGQQTMLNVGRALMAKPTLLLLDEPMLGLDPQNARKLINALRAIRSERPIGIIVAEQSAMFAQSFPDRLLLMSRGEIVFDGCLREARGSAAFSDVFA